MAVVEIPGYCTLCRSRCGTLNQVDGDVLRAVRPDPSHPTGHAMCLKGRAAPELVASPHRLTRPMRRTRPKGAVDPGWTPIGWDEAMALIAARLGETRAAHGAEAVAFAVTTPSGTPLSDSIDWIERFVRAFGSPNICYGTEICNWHKDHAHKFTFGCGMPTADYAEADLVMLWGHNPANVWLAQANAIGRGRAGRARMLVIDPRRTALAAQADCWLRVRPGTDAALAMGLANLLIARGAWDAEFVRHWTNAPLLVRGDTGQFLRHRDVDPAGGDAWMVWDSAAQAPVPLDTRQANAPQVGECAALRGEYAVPGIGRCAPAFEHFARACAEYPPARVEAITWVPQHALREAADLIAASPRVAYHAWTGIGQHANATQSERAVATLYALTGSFDRPGGNRQYLRQPANPVSGMDLIPPTQLAKALGAAERPLGPAAQGWVTGRDLYRAILDGEPYRVRAVMAFGTNLLVSQADTAMGREALAALDFYVHCDLFETPSARDADLLLPINTPWEREGLRIGFEISAEAEARVQLRQRMVSPRGESRSDNDIVFELATRLGMGRQFFDGSLEAGWNHQLAPLGLTVAQLREQPAGVIRPIAQRDEKYRDPVDGGVRGFDTPTRRVELYSERLLTAGYPPVPSFVEPPDAPRGGDFPLVLSSAKNGYFCHSQHRSLVSLRRKAWHPRVAMHPSVAAARDIRDGEPVCVRTRVGEARFEAALDEALHPGVVVAEYGWWQACPELGLPATPVEGPGHRNFNALVAGDHVDPVSGSTPLRSFACELVADPAFDRARRPWTGERAFVVQALRREGEDVMAVALAPADGGGLPDYQPGQHVSVRVPREDGSSITRAYSLTGPAASADRRAYTIAVRLAQARVDGEVQTGAMSGHIHQRLAVGDPLWLRAPSGGFVVPRRSPQPVVLLAGGVGITPFLAHLESLVDAPEDMPEVWLYYANRGPASHAFRDRIAALAARLPRLTVTDFHDCADAPAGVTAGRLEAAHVPQDLIDRRARFYMCGPVPMMDALSAGLIARGVPAFDLFKEVFRSPAPPPVDDGRSYRVRFALQDREAVWTPADGPLLDFGERLGVAMPSGCRVGQCESCAVRVADGRVAHADGVVPDDPDVCLTCQAVPVSDLVLVL